MSRPTQRAGSTATKRNTDDGDICPVCKSSRYLNPNMRFMVSSECYHRMCESCVDRIYTHGTTTCPIAGCKRQLRKNRFRPQMFEDLKVEREVDIRRRVNKVLNKTQEDFETLKDYNDYLEISEESIFNLINGIDVAATEARLRSFAAAQKEEEAQLTAGATRDSIPSEPAAGRNQPKKPAQRRPLDKTQAKVPPSQASAAENVEQQAFAFKGLKKRVAPEPEKPYDPFEGWSTAPEYFVLQDFYDVGAWLNAPRDDPAHTTGGYDIGDYTQRALIDAFSGFTVFVEDEVKQRSAESGDSSTATVQAAKAAAVGGDVDMGAVF